MGCLGDEIRVTALQKSEKVGKTLCDRCFTDINGSIADGNNLTLAGGAQQAACAAGGKAQIRDIQTGFA
jgi:hypothetical protein